MQVHYWSVDGCSPEPGAKVAGALVTPWSAHVLPAPALPHPASAADVLRMPSRDALGAVPAPRPQPEGAVSV